MSETATEGRADDGAALGGQRDGMGGQQPGLLAAKASATFMIPMALLEDHSDMSDLLGKALRGEIELKPPPEPRYHRCFACWLISLLPGHGRCQHGRLACDDCCSDY